MTPRLLVLLSDHQGRAGPLLRRLADPQRVASRCQFDLGLAQLRLELASSRPPLFGVGPSSPQLTAEGGGESEVLGGTLACLFGGSCSHDGPAPRRLATQFDDDRVQQCGSQDSEDEIEDQDETGADQGGERESRQHGHGGDEPGGNSTPARTRRPVLALGIS